MADNARDRFEEHLRRAGLRSTNKRLAIFRATLARKEHFTAEELLEHARRIDRGVSRATVYRTLPILTESGLVREVDVGRNIKFYFPSGSAEPPKAQVFCEDCERIFEINAPFLEWYGRSVAERVGLAPVSQRLQVNARCPRAKEPAGCPNRGAAR
jgi:Fur family ferric uptake transcriptional regulator